MSSKSEISEQLDRWMAAVEACSSERILKLYAEEAVLLPTLSSKVRHDQDEIRDYFEHFLSMKPKGRVVEENIRIYGDMAVNSGLYTFSMGKPEAPGEVEARFTFVYRRAGGSWVIVEHHSSVSPA